MAKLDEFDLKMLETLKKDGVTSKVKLAEAVNLSASPTWERLRKLEVSGAISGYHARVNLNKFSPVTTIIVEVMLKHHQIGDFKRFEDAVIELPGVVECLATGGGVDYVMRVVGGDVDVYQRFMDALLQRGIGTGRYFSYIVTKMVKGFSGPSLSLLAKKIVLISSFRKKNLRHMESGSETSSPLFEVQ